MPPRSAGDLDKGSNNSLEASPGTTAGGTTMTIHYTEFSYKRTIPTPYDETIARVTQALEQEGFGTLTQIDVKGTLKEKLDINFRRYLILGACNPVLAHRALKEELEIGLFLPCNVILFEEGEETVVAILDPTPIFNLVKNPDLKPIAEEARARLVRVLESLAD
jgi:uncharacterized protein (DUF302 family)